MIKCNLNFNHCVELLDLSLLDLDYLYDFGSNDVRRGYILRFSTTLCLFLRYCLIHRAAAADLSAWLSICNESV